MQIELTPKEAGLLVKALTERSWSVSNKAFYFYKDIINKITSNIDYDEYADIAFPDCGVCKGKGYRLVQKPFPDANNYSPLSTCTCSERCYLCKEKFAAFEKQDS